jgi:S-adenosylmethionine:tRNA ribosyltransferase-isomerase
MNVNDQILISDYTYTLPEVKIAVYPLDKRDESKLLVYNNEVCKEDVFKNITTHLPSNTLMVMNDSKVIPARIIYQKPTGAVIELFCLEPYNTTIELAMQATDNVMWKCFIGGFSKWKHEIPLQWSLSIDNMLITLFATYKGKEADYFIVEFSNPSAISFLQILQVLGTMPIPPYLKRNAEDKDSTQYQTVYATVSGSVAAPTAGLHFTNTLLTQIEQHHIDIEKITLHVGAGTFKPVTAQVVQDHVMHAEYVIVSKKLLQKLLAKPSNIICVGTTSLRSIESIYLWALHCYTLQQIVSSDYVVEQWVPYKKQQDVDKHTVLQWILHAMAQKALDQISFKTQIIIVPGYSFKYCNILVTNFHQPNSTLLLLVAAFTNGNWRNIYNYALANHFRFLSFGDSSLLFRNSKV